MSRIGHLIHQAQNGDILLFFLLGWGRDRYEGNSHDELHEVMLDIYSSSSAKQEWGSWYDELLMVAAGVRGEHKSSCQVHSSIQFENLAGGGGSVL